MYGARIPTHAKKLSNRERLRRADQAIDLGNRATLILLAVLAQSGGEVTVTQGTIDQVSLGIVTGELDYAIVDGKNKNEHIVRLVTGHEDAPLEPSPENVQEVVSGD